MDSQTTQDTNLIIYGHDYCPQAQLLVAALSKYQVDYEWRDIMQGEPHFQDELRQLANGHLSVPTLIFPDGTVMVEPWPGKVLKKLGLKKEGLIDRLVKKWQGT